MRSLLYCRWSKQYSAVHLEGLPHRVLTRPCLVTRIDFTEAGGFFRHSKQQEQQSQQQQAADDADPSPEGGLQSTTALGGNSSSRWEGGGSCGGSGGTGDCGLSGPTLLQLEVVEKGVLNAVVFWFDLHLDEADTISSAPPSTPTGISSGNGGDGRGSSDGGGGGSGGGGGGSGTADSSSGTRGHYWGQALQYLDCALPVAPSSNNGSGTIPVLVDR